MKKRLLLALLAIVTVSAAADLNAPTTGLSGDARALLVERMQQMSDGAVWWAEYYSYGAVDHAYFMGRAEGLRFAARMLEDAQ